jgi:hypothetical protein
MEQFGPRPPKRSLLIEAELVERGMLRPDGDARGLLSKNPAFLKLNVECLKLVRLERRAIDENDLDAVLRREAK